MRQVDQHGHPAGRSVGEAVAMVSGAFRDGQLDNADLTFRELATAKATIAKTLGTMLHGRVKYPKEEPDEVDLFKAAAKAAAETPGKTPENPEAGSPDSEAADNSNQRNEQDNGNGKRA